MTDHVIQGLRSASAAIVADACDALGLRQQAMTGGVSPILSGATLIGRAYPVNVVVDTREPAEPYEGEMAALSAMRPGDVGVYAVEGDSRAAAWGELFSCAAIGRGVAGVIVDGCVRDVRQMREMDFPVFARAVSPLDTRGRARVSQHGNPILCSGVTVHAGDVVVADSDGVVIVPSSRAGEVVELVAAKRHLEEAAKDDLKAGTSIRDVWEKYQVF